jgi:acetyl esterase
MIWYWEHYLNNPAERSNPYAAPMQAASLAGLPPAMIVTAEYDPLRDEGKAYADRLRQEGVPVVYRCYSGMIHGFVSSAAVIDGGKQAIADMAAEIRRTLG